MNTLSVSVVIDGAANVPTLKTAIRSVLAQTYPVTQVIVVADRSDPNMELLEALMRADPRITPEYVNHPTSAADARNAGIANADGDVVGFLASHDSWAPTKVATQVGLLAASGASWSASDELHIDGRWHAIRALRLAEAASLPARLVQSPPLMSRSSVVVLRTVLEQVGGFDPRAGCLADWDCWITLALGYGPPALADDALVAIRSVPDEFSSAGRDVWSCYQYVVAKHSVSAGQQALSFPRAPRPLFVHSMSQRCASNRGEARSRFVHGLRTPQSPPLGIRRASGFARARAWRARCTIPKTWIHSAEGWLTQLMKLEVRDGQDR